MSSLFTLLVIFILNATAFCMWPAEKQISISTADYTVFIKSLMALSEADLRDSDNVLVALDDEMSVPLKDFDITQLYNNFFEVIFNPATGFFQISENQPRSLMISRNFDLTFDCQMFYIFFGRLLALAHKHGWVLPKLLNPVLYKLLLSHPIFDINDVWELDEVIYRSLVSCMENEDVEDLLLTFECIFNGRLFSLIPNGSQVDVTADNVKVFVDHYSVAVCRLGRCKQADLIKKGIKDVMGKGCLSISSLYSQQLLGSWKLLTEYEDCDATTPSVVCFWKVVEGCDVSGRLYAYEKLTGIKSDVFASDPTCLRALPLHLFKLVLSPHINAIHIIPNERTIMIPVIQDAAEMYKLLAQVLNHGR